MLLGPVGGQAVRCLGILGRAAIVALSREALSFRPYKELINKEAEVIGVSDHLASELPSLMRYAQSGQLTFPESALRCRSRRRARAVDPPLGILTSDELNPQQWLETCFSSGLRRIKCNLLPGRAWAVSTSFWRS